MTRGREREERREGVLKGDLGVGLGGMGVLDDLEGRE